MPTSTPMASTLWLNRRCSCHEQLMPLPSSNPPEISNIRRCTYLATTEVNPTVVTTSLIDSFLSRSSWILRRSATGSSHRTAPCRDDVENVGLAAAESPPAHTSYLKSGLSQSLTSRLGGHQSIRHNARGLDSACPVYQESVQPRPSSRPPAASCVRAWWS
jgi:hypothetical protein